MSAVPALPDIRFSLIGGHVAMDLINTVEWRRDPAQSAEELTSYGHLVVWARQTELLAQDEARALAALAEEHPRLAERALDDVAALREAAYAALLGGDDTAAETITRRYAEALSRSVLTRGDPAWAWREMGVSLDTIGDRLAISVIDLMRSPDVAWLHQCEDVICGWVYLDTSRRRNRRWCVADECGNRNRARAYYARKTGRA
ncbi:MAG: CGNR zinc finger domain-containing protein [Dermatophilaceae bacterium]